MTTNGEFKIAYLIIGFGLGLLAGVLYAPRSGEETRKQVRRRTDEGLDYLYEQTEKLRDNADKIVETTKEWISRQGESLRSAAESATDYQERKGEL